MIRSGIVLTLAVALVFALATPALASGPPLGKYGCTIGSGYAGNLRILSNHRYRLNRSKIGRFRVRAGRKLTFPSGVWHGLFKGRWYKTSDGKWEIALTSLESGYESSYCDKES